MELKRNLARWAAMSPKVISEGSPAQFMHAMADAQHDIAELAEEIDRLRADSRAIHLTNQICTHCGATLRTYDTVCSASLDERCEGFQFIETQLRRNNR